MTQNPRFAPRLWIAASALTIALGCDHATPVSPLIRSESAPLSVRADMSQAALIVQFGPDGNLYVAGDETNAVLRYSGSDGGFIDVFADHLSTPSCLVFGPDGNLYVTSADGVKRYNGRSGAFIDDFVGQGSGGVSVPVGIVFGPDGAFYVASAGTGAILRCDGRTGQFRDAFVKAGSGGMDGPRAIEFQNYDHRLSRLPWKWGVEEDSRDRLSIVARSRRSRRQPRTLLNGTTRGEFQ